MTWRLPHRDTGTHPATHHSLHVHAESAARPDGRATCVTHVTSSRVSAVKNEKGAETWSQRCVKFVRMLAERPRLRCTQRSLPEARAMMHFASMMCGAEDFASPEDALLRPGRPGSTRSCACGRWCAASMTARVEGHTHALSTSASHQAALTGSAAPWAIRAGFGLPYSLRCKRRPTLLLCVAVSPRLRGRVERDSQVPFTLSSLECM